MKSAMTEWPRIDRLRSWLSASISNRITFFALSLAMIASVGIGLYMSKVIVENNMGGRLTARNVVGGAEFRIEI